MALLDANEVRDLAAALIDSGLDPNANRGALFQSFPPRFVGSFSVGMIPVAQFLSDLNRMNQVERLTNGDVPLEIYLRNADLLISGTPQQVVIREMLNRVLQRATGAPAIDLTAVREIREEIIHVDDTVTLGFMEGGVRAASSVMKLRVPRFEGGQPKMSNGNPVHFLGTGWLLTQSLVVTNHHVVNARKYGEANAPESDLRLQAAGTVAQFDFDADGLAGVEVAVTALEAWHATLDYAVLRIPPANRAPLTRAAAAIRDITDPVSVNIIQHPGGRSKRFGIRNNLVSASEATELRYFTDTERGSSGSPVFDDQWQVVALHRASRYVTGVKFQGKATAYVNVGTHLTSILDDLRARFPALAAEISN